MDGVGIYGYIGINNGNGDGSEDEEGRKEYCVEICSYFSSAFNFPPYIQLANTHTQTDRENVTRPPLSPPHLIMLIISPPPPPWQWNEMDVVVVCTNKSVEDSPIGDSLSPGVVRTQVSDFGRDAVQRVVVTSVVPRKIDNGIYSNCGTESDCVYWRCGRKSRMDQATTTNYAKCNYI